MTDDQKRKISLNQSTTLGLQNVLKIRIDVRDIQLVGGVENIESAFKCRMILVFGNITSNRPQ